MNSFKKKRETPMNMIFQFSNNVKGFLGLLSKLFTFTEKIILLLAAFVAVILHGGEAINTIPSKISHPTQNMTADSLVCDDVFGTSNAIEHYQSCINANVGDQQAVYFHWRNEGIVTVENLMFEVLDLPAGMSIADDSFELAIGEEDYVVVENTFPNSIGIPTSIPPGEGFWVSFMLKVVDCIGTCGEEYTFQDFFAVKTNEATSTFPLRVKVDG